VYGDLVGVAEHLDALQAGNVDQHAAREERRRVLHAELGEAGARRRLADLEAVVKRIAVALVREAVELRADLADLGGDDLLVAAARVPAGVHEGALGVQVEDARAGEGHAGPEHVAQLDDLAGLDEPRAAQHDLGVLHVVARAALVARAPLRRAALGFGRHVPLRGGDQRDCKQGSGDALHPFPLS